MQGSLINYAAINSGKAPTLLICDKKEFISGTMGNNANRVLTC